MAKAELKLKSRLRELVPTWREEFKSVAKTHGNHKFDEVTVDQVIGGMRDICSLVCETSYLDPKEGIRFRGYSIPEARAKLPRPTPDSEPYPTAMYYLLLTGEIPEKDAVLELEAEMRKRMVLPNYVIDLMKVIPVVSHPMSQLSMVVLGMQRESIFDRRYREGTLKKEDQWEAMFEDSLTLLARLPMIAAYIYRRKYQLDTIIAPDPNLDWGANYGHMLGFDSAEFQNLVRLFLLIYSDHESGNVSAHTGFVIGSALSDLFYIISGSLNGLAGPLHGLAIQENMKWIFNLMQEVGSKPTKEQVAEYARNTLKAGKVIPGYGHAVLRVPDPRYIAFREFAQKYMPDDAAFQLVSTVFEVVPDILKAKGTVKNPWPNVDGHAGCNLHHYGLTEFDYYTVMFGVSRALGVSAQAVWARAVNAPIERPKSVTMKMIKDSIAGKKAEE